MGVIEFRRKEPDEPHMAGNARCIGCGHKWAAVAPVGTYDQLECPECHAFKGVMLGMCMPEREVFICNCGNALFYIDRNGMLCANCGTWANGF